MDLFLGLIFLYFTIGLIVYFSTIKEVRRKIALIEEETGEQEKTKTTKYVIWWLVGFSLWVIVGISLVISWFL